MKWLSKFIVSDTNPFLRLSCSLSLGASHKYIGGMSGDTQLKTTFGLLMSLSVDPHPLVHLSATMALVDVIEASGLTFVNHQKTIVSYLLNQIICETYDDGRLPLYGDSESMLASFLCCLGAAINVMGPDLQSHPEITDNIFPILFATVRMKNDLISTQALKCCQYMDMQAVAWTCLEQLMRRNPSMLIEVVGTSFSTILWKAYENALTNDLVFVQNIKGIIEIWAMQTTILNIYLWIEMCSRILLKGECYSVSQNTQPEFNIDEGASFNVDSYSYSKSELNSYFDMLS